MSTVNAVISTQKSAGLARRAKKRQVDSEKTELKLCENFEVQSYNGKVYLRFPIDADNKANVLKELDWHFILTETPQDADVYEVIIRPEAD